MRYVAPVCVCLFMLNLNLENSYLVNFVCQGQGHRRKPGYTHIGLRLKDDLNLLVDDSRSVLEVMVMLWLQSRTANTPGISSARTVGVSSRSLYVTDTRIVA